MANKVILAGGSGFLGQAIAGRMKSAGWEIVVLSRDPRSNAPFREVPWDGKTAGTWVTELEDATALINLAGRSITCVHTQENRQEIISSRLQAVQALAAGYAAMHNPPPLWLQASAIGYYGNTADVICAETQVPGTDFLAETCRQWEAALHAAHLPGVRRVVLRIGVVLDAHHGALPPLVGLTKKFLGGSVGSGRQYLSWIHRDDLINAVETVLTRSAFTGTYNACAPHPVTNADFMRELRAVVGRPWCPPAPVFMVKLMAGPLLGVDPSLALHGQRGSAQRLQAEGLEFKYPALGPALRDLLVPTPT